MNLISEAETKLRDRNQVEILGINIDRVDMEQTLKQIEEFIGSGIPHLIVSANVDTVVHSFTNKKFKEIVNSADLVVADGVPLIWASRFLGDPLPGRVNGTDLVYELCRLSHIKGYSIYFLGAGPGVAAAAAENLRQLFPKVKIVGVHSPPTGKFTQEEQGAMVERITAAKPDILLVAFGQPKQENWLWRHLEEIGVPAGIGIGGSFDIISGRVSRAPKRVQRWGLEWLFRLIQEPKRLWKRYLRDFLFVFQVSSIILTDMLTISSSWLLAWWIRYQLNDFLDNPINPLSGYLLALPGMVTIWIITCLAFGLYKQRPRPFRVEEIGSLLKTVFLGLLITMSISFLVKEFDFGRSVVLLFAVTNFLFLYTTRTLVRKFEEKIFERGYGLIRTLIVGVGELAQKLGQDIEDYPKVGYEVVGYVTPHHSREVKGTNGLPVLGSIGQLKEIITRERIKEVFFAEPNLSRREILDQALDCEEAGAHPKVIISIFDIFQNQVHLNSIEDHPVVDLGGGCPRKGYLFCKRLMDLSLSLLGLIISLPLWLLIGLAIKWDSKGKAMFSHERVGQHGKPFTLYKFRTMYSDAGEYEEAPRSPADPRITRIGKLLRKTSLDELPQLINVLKGEMSLVGPRPEMPFIVQNYGGWQRKRLEVKPGITGLWQILGRKDIPLHENLEYDFYYLKNRSLILDLTILLKTLPSVIFSKGAY